MPRSIAAILFLTILLGGCGATYDDVASHKSQLLGSFTSYATPEEAKAVLPDVEWTVVREFSTGDGEDIPRYDILVWSIESYEAYEHVGKLQIMFFNNRLMETRFEPNESRSFLAALELQDLAPGGRDAVVINPHTVIWSLRESNAVYVFGWADRRLLREVDDWLAKYNT